MDKKVEDSEAEEGKRQTSVHVNTHMRAHVHAAACQLINNSKSVLSTFVSL